MRRNDEVEHDDIAFLSENAVNRDPNNEGRATQAMNAVTLHTINTPGGRFPYLGITKTSF